MLEFMNTLQGLFLLRRGPQDFPFSPTLLWGLVAVNLVFDVALGGLLGTPGTALAASLATTAVVLGFLYLLLKSRQMLARFVQAGTALSAAALVFSLLAIPAQVALTPMPVDPALLTEPQRLGLLFAAFLGGWSLAITAHVLRHALERSFFQGLLLALLMNFGAAIAVQLAVPAPPVP
ncbi:MAG TPA: hypothetical protein VFN09_00740 [Rhodanobacteraceae bacterium]|nr:hypothetical protein [Rhodanobacteraceae bacterium]